MAKKKRTDSTFSDETARQAAAAAAEPVVRRLQMTPLIRQLLLCKVPDLDAFQEVFGTRDGDQNLIHIARDAWPNEELTFAHLVVLRRTLMCLEGGRPKDILEAIDKLIDRTDGRPTMTVRSEEGERPAEELSDAELLARLEEGD